MHDNAKSLTLLCFSTGTLSSIPTALTRWTEECKVLDAESMHDCVSGVWQFGYQGSSESSRAGTVHGKLFPWFSVAPSSASWLSPPPPLSSLRSLLLWSSC